MNTCELLEISSSIVPDRTAVIFENQKLFAKHFNKIEILTKCWAVLRNNNCFRQQFQKFYCIK